MSVIGKLIISLVVAAIAATLLGLFHGAATPFLIAFGAFSAATIATALLTSIKISPTGSAQSSSPSPKKASNKPAKKTREKAPAKPLDSANREEGEVKWFNVTKGFGFITRNNGEEIFVHFRSIRGENRRGLRDGQKVSFVVTESDKGPQAEDVEGL
jgi:CspA family cold shock protein